LKKHNNCRKKREQPSRRAESRRPVQRDTKEVLAELVGKLKEKLDPKRVGGWPTQARFWLECDIRIHGAEALPGVS